MQLKRIHFYQKSIKENDHTLRNLEHKLLASTPRRNNAIMAAVGYSCRMRNEETKFAQFG